MAESEYLRQTVGEPLARCLADVVLHRPHDPIEYIALWLYKHSANVQNELRLTKEAEQLAKELEEAKIAKELVIQLAKEEEELHQKEREQVAKLLEEAQRLQVYHMDNAADKHGPVPAVHSVASVQHHAYVPEKSSSVEQEEEEEEEEKEKEEEKEEARSPVQSNVSQNVAGSESEVIDPEFLRMM